MGKLKIDLGSCVRVYSKFSECSKCQEVCPKDAISYDENIPKVSTECIDCGGCIGVCPTEAISLSNFDTLEFIFSFLESGESLISCKKNTPCLATFSVENLISMVILADKIQLDMGYCDSCEIADPLKGQIERNIDEANEFLESIGSEKLVLRENIAYKEPKEPTTGNRRDFLKRFSLKGALESKAEFEKALEDEEVALDATHSASIREKVLPNKRKLLFMALKRIEKAKEYRYFDEGEITFTSDKIVDESCDNCSFCYRLCPTGALTTDRRASKILFDSNLCVKCALCHDVCEKESIKLISFSTKGIFEPEVKELVNFKVVRCDECANYFTYFGGEKICPRCKTEEEEAKRLWGIE